MKWFTKEQPWSRGLSGGNEGSHLNPFSGKLVLEPPKYTQTNSNHSTAKFGRSESEHVTETLCLVKLEFNQPKIHNILIVLFTLT